MGSKVRVCVSKPKGKMRGGYYLKTNDTILENGVPLYKYLKDRDNNVVLIKKGDEDSLYDALSSENDYSLANVQKVNNGLNNASIVPSNVDVKPSTVVEIPPNTSEEQNALQNFKTTYSILEAFINDVKALNWSKDDIDSECNASLMEDHFPYYYYPESSDDMTLNGGPSAQDTKGHQFITKHKDTFYAGYSNDLMSSINKVIDKSKIKTEVDNIKSIYMYENWKNRLDVSEPIDNIFVSKENNILALNSEKNVKSVWTKIMDNKCSLSIFLLLYFNFFRDKGKEPFPNLISVRNANDQTQRMEMCEYDKLKEKYNSFEDQVSAFQNFQTYLYILVP